MVDWSWSRQKKTNLYSLVDKHWLLDARHATTSMRMKKHNFVQIVAQVGPWCDQTVGSLNA